MRVCTGGGIVWFLEPGIVGGIRILGAGEFGGWRFLVYFPGIGGDEGTGKDFGMFSFPSGLGHSHLSLPGRKKPIQFSAGKHDLRGGGGSGSGGIWRRYVLLGLVV